MGVSGLQGHEIIALPVIKRDTQKHDIFNFLLNFNSTKDVKRVVKK